MTSLRYVAAGVLAVVALLGVCACTVSVAAWLYQHVAGWLATLWLLGATTGLVVLIVWVIEHPPHRRARTPRTPKHHTAGSSQ